MPMFTKRFVSGGLQRFCIAAATLSLSFSGSSGAGPETALLCELVLNEVMYEKNVFGGKQSEEFISCHPVEDETGFVSPLMYSLNLPDSLLRESRQRLVKNEEVYVFVPGGKLSKNDVIVPNPASIKIVKHEQASRRKRQLAERRRPVVGKFKVLMLRVIANDSEPDFSARTLHYLTFEDKISLKHQMAKCSFGQLEIEPTEYGVLDVRIDMDIAGVFHNEAVNAAYKAAVKLVKEDVRDVRELADGVMLVIPPGSKGSWAAFGALNGKQTTFNNKWGGYVGGAMHEIGHNLGLLHSYENGDEYGGKTGYMGSAPKRLYYPEKCFNGQNNWHLGWYRDRALELDFDTDLKEPLLLDMAAFVDYKKTRQGSYVVLKIGDYYFQYNRAKSFNKNTSEKKDSLTVVKFIPNVGTNLIEGLNLSKPLLQRRIGGELLTVKVCSMKKGSKSSPDTLQVSVGRNNAGACPTSPPSPFPVIPPSPSPTAAPTHTSTKAHTDIPTPITTQAPTPAPSPSPVKEPTFSPTRAPTRDPVVTSTFSQTAAPIVDLTVAPTSHPADRPVPTVFREPSVSSDPPSLSANSKKPTSVGGGSNDAEVGSSVDDETNPDDTPSEDSSGALSDEMYIVLLVSIFSVVVLCVLVGACYFRSDRRLKAYLPEDSYAHDSAIMLAKNNAESISVSISDDSSKTGTGTSIDTQNRSRSGSDKFAVEPSLSVGYGSQCSTGNIVEDLPQDKYCPSEVSSRQQRSSGSVPLSLQQVEDAVRDNATAISSTTPAATNWYPTMTRVPSWQSFFDLEMDNSDDSSEGSDENSLYHV